MWTIQVKLLLICLMSGVLHGLENGLARTPPMGWLAWERFRCNTDCDNDPENCISEQLFMKMAELIATEGYKDAGYDVVSLDDCWMDHQRSADGKLQPDPKRFPSGLKALGDYIHSFGLKFGMYEDYGNFTCGGYPGIMYHLETDANSFAEWGIDYVKLDGCYADIKDMDTGYPAFGEYLRKTGRPMVYSCSWPDYQIFSGMKPNMTAVSTACNLWRNYDDIDDSWESVTTIIDHYATEQDEMAKWAGPGHWNDPDMLIIGNFGLSYEQSKAQMAIWSILAAPLIMSNDLRTIRPEYKAILLNKEVIAINQDALGIQGKRISKDNGKEVWVKPVLPMKDQELSASVVYFNRRPYGTPDTITKTLKDMGLNSPNGYKVRNLFDGVDMGVLLPNQQLSVKVNPSGGVVMFKLTVI